MGTHKILVALMCLGFLIVVVQHNLTGWLAATPHLLPASFRRAERGSRNAKAAARIGRMERPRLVNGSAPAWWAAAQAATGRGEIHRAGVSISGAQVPSGWIETLGWKPRSFVYHGFLSVDECDHIIKLAEPRLVRSTAVNSAGEVITDEIRTSSGMFIERRADEVISRVEERLAAWTQLPVVHGEAMQVLRYSKGQKYGPHWDLFEGNSAASDDGDRIATVLIYLNTPPAGGETAFPRSFPPDDWHEQRGGAESWSKCGRSGLAVRAVKGDALLFFSLKPDGTKDDASMHTGCPPTTDEGLKWVATKWLHTKPFRPLPGEEDCEDKKTECAQWAEKGECAANRPFMVSQCADSCGFC